MFRNFIKTAIRNIIKNKVYSTINLVGLSIGIASFLLLFLWIKDELNFNKFHENYSEIYQLYSEYHERDNVWQTPLTPDLAAPLLVEQYPTIKNAARLNNQPSSVKVGDNTFNEQKLFYTDPSFFEVFSAEPVLGSPVEALSEPNMLVITEKLAKKYFGKDDPLNQTITINGKYVFKVGSVVKEFPNNSTIDFDLLLPYKFLDSNNLMWSYWSFGRIETYILGDKNVSKELLDNEISGFAKEHAPDFGFIFRVQPMAEIHLYNLAGEKEGMKSVQIFALIAVCILLIACFNFINLTTAQYTKRVKEISIKQIVGSGRYTLVRYVFSETLFYVLIAGIIALIFIELFRVPFNHISNKELIINYLEPQFLVNLAVVFILVSLFSSLYPSFFITRFKPLNILSGELTKGIRGKRMRKIIIILQFSISIVLIISTLIVLKQFRYIHSKDCGYKTEDIVYMPVKGKATQEYSVIKKQLKDSPYIENVALVSELPSFVGIGTSNFDYEGKDPSDDKGFQMLSVDHDFLNVVSLDLVQGRNYSLDRIADSTNYILNEEAIRYMGLENPIGSRFSMFGIEGEIIGVVEDFNFLPINQQIGPIFLAIIPNYYAQFLIKIDSNNIKKGLNHVQKVWEEFLPDYAFEYEFWDEHKSSLYETEERLINIFLYFTILAILIASLGLVGLSLFTTQLKTKEIGIRKVNGASIRSILKLFINEYNLWMLISIVISSPIAYLIMRRWLQNYAYSIKLSWWIFTLSILFIYLIGFFSMVVQIVIAAKRNPVDSLRYE